MPNVKTRSVFSFRSSLLSIDDIIDHAVKYGYEYAFLTDFNTLSGAQQFYSKAKSTNIKPCIGAEVGVSFSLSRKDRNICYVVLIVLDKTGYSNLCRILSIANVEGFYRVPRIDFDVLASHSDGLCCILSYTRSPFIYSDNENVTKFVLEKLKTIFSDRFYCQLVPGQGGNIKTHNEAALSLFSKNKLIVSTNAHYLWNEESPDNYTGYDLLYCIRNNLSFFGQERNRPSKTDALMPDDVMLSLLAVDPSLREELLHNTDTLASMVNFEFDNSIKIPKIPGVDSTEFIKQKVNEGWRRRKRLIPKDKIETYKQRLYYELDVISKHGFQDYFAIVGTIVDWAKNKAGVLVGPGRGSAAGSLISYMMGITEVDPIKAGLMFERFLTPEGKRTTAPDIDLDFQASRRQEVLKFIFSTFGAENCSLIGNFGTLAVRSAMKDVARVIGIDYDTANKLTKYVPFGARSFDEIDSLPEIKQVKKENKQFAKLYNLSKLISGTLRQPGTHAAGVVISPFPITDYIPQQKIRRADHVVTQYDMNTIDALGFLKIDVLGLTALDTIAETMRLAHIDVEYNDIYSIIDLDDQAAYDLVNAGHTCAVFQLEGRGITKLLMRMGISSIREWCDLIAVYRPAVLDSNQHEMYIHNKYNANKRLIHPLLEEYLHDTNYILLYQEQLMHMSRVIASFTYEEADLLRKGVAKKRPDILADIKPKFISGAVKNGLSQREAKELFSIIEKAGRYGFNKAHSFSYALIGYIMAYLKAHYPTEFMCAALNAEWNNHQKIGTYINECNNMGIKVLPPDINKSNVRFAIEDLTKRTIRYGFAPIKNIGFAAAHAILSARTNYGLFRSFTDFLDKVDLGVVNINAVKALILAGCFDRFGIDRSILYSNAEAHFKVARKNKRTKALSLELFANPDVSSSDTVGDLSDYQLAMYEKELLGTSFMKG
jgi:DNA polymerase-3 subunit alpha